MKKKFLSIILTTLIFSNITLIQAAEFHQPGNFKDETIYNINVSRFFDGDESNNYYNRERIEKGDPHWRGDFKGLISKLDYIKDLGFTTICISQPVENRGGLDFSGNYSYDWLKIDPRLESPDASYYDLITAAHTKGIRLIQTLVMNHSSNYGIRNEFFVPRLPIKFYKASTEPTWPYIFNWGNHKHPFRMDNDNPCAPDWFKDFLYRDQWAAGPLKDPVTGTMLPQEGFPAERFFGTDETQLDGDLYHKAGWFQNASNLDQSSVQNQHIEENALDLATENWRVKDYFKKVVKKYLDMGVDGFRLQFARNIPRYDLLVMLNDWKAMKPDLYVFADVSPVQSGLGKLNNETEPSELCPWWYSKTTSITNDPDGGPDSGLVVMDYPLFKSFAENITQGYYSGIEKILQFDWAYGDPYKLVTFFHNFDNGPETGNLTKFSGETSIAANAYTLLWTMRGVPSIIAGEEIEFQKGFPQVPVTDYDMLSSTGKAYFGDNLSDANIANSQAHSIYKHIKRLNLIRASIPALRTGKIENGKTWASGMSFVRNYNNGESYAVVGLSAVIPQAIRVERVLAGTYIDAISGNSIDVATDSLTIEFNVNANSAGIYVLRGPGKIGEDGDFLR